MEFMKIRRSRSSAARTGGGCRRRGRSRRGSRSRRAARPAGRTRSRRLRSIDVDLPSARSCRAGHRPECARGGAAVATRPSPARGRVPGGLRARAGSCGRGRRARPRSRPVDRAPNMTIEPSTWRALDRWAGRGSRCAASSARRTATTSRPGRRRGSPAASARAAGGRSTAGGPTSAATQPSWLATHRPDHGEHEHPQQPARLEQRAAPAQEATRAASAR